MLKHELTIDETAQAIVALSRYKAFLEEAYAITDDAGIPAIIEIVVTTIIKLGGNDNATANP